MASTQALLKRLKITHNGSVCAVVVLALQETQDEVCKAQESW